MTVIETVTREDMGSYLLVVSSGTVETAEDLKELNNRIAEQIAQVDHRTKIIDDERNLVHKEDVLAIVDYFKQLIDKLAVEYRQVRAATLVSA